MEVEFVTERARFLWPPVDRGPVTPERRGAYAESTRRFVSSATWGLFGILFNVGLILTVLYAAVIPIGWLTRAVYLGPGGDDDIERVTFAGGWWAVILVLVGLGPHLAAFLWGFLGTFEVADPRSKRTGTGIAPRAVLVAVIVVGGAFGVGALLRWGLPASAWWPGWTWALVGQIALFLAVALVVAFIIERSANGVPAVVILTGLVLIGANWLDAAIELGPETAATWRAVVTIAGILAGLIGFVGVAAIVRLLPVPRRASMFAVLLGIAVVAGVAIGIITGVVAWAATDEYRIGPAWAVYLVVAGTLLATYAFLDQKRWSPHPIYKRRLAGTFSPVRYRGSERAVEVAQLPYSTRTTLSSWLEPVDGHPELLVCAAAYDTRKAVGSVRAWPFVFAHDYVGGADIGWTRTVDFEAALGRSNAPDGTLLAAMAISGAAVSPGLGQISLGSLNIVLAILNARLGVWLPNPRYVNELRDPERWRSRETPALR